MPPLLAALLGRLRRGAVVLDAGCGPAQDVRFLRRRCVAIGLDLCEPFLRFARRRGDGLLLIRADLRVVPLKAGVLDAVWAAAALIHLPPAEVARVCARWHALVRPGGLLAATVVQGRTCGVTRTGWIPGRYVSKWHKAKLKRVVERAGWEVLRLETVSNRERAGRWLNLLARKKTENGKRER